MRAALEGVRGGRWLEDDELERAGALFPAREYGEDIYLLDPGVLMVPSFMGSQPARGHAWLRPGAPGDGRRCSLANHPVPAGVRHLKDVRGFLEDGLAWLAEAR